MFGNWYRLSGTTTENYWVRYYIDDICTCVYNDNTFGDKVIFDDTHIEIEKHDFIIIYGESGIGKSTLLKMIGLINNFDGDYFINDKLVNKKR